MDKDPNKISHVKSQIAIAKGKWERIYARCRKDMRMAAGVDSNQFSEEDRKARGENRAQFSFPILDKFVERVVGAYNNSPFGIGFESSSEGGAPIAKIMSGVIGGVECESNAKYAYRQALRNTATCGYGWLYACTEYADEYSDSLDIKVKIKAVLNPDSVMLDPNSVEIDGRDAEWAIHQDSMSLGAAKAEFGEDVLTAGEETGVGLMDPSKARWADSKDSVPVVTYFERNHKWRTVWIAEDGTKSDEQTEIHTRSKRVKTSDVTITKIVGNKVVSDVTLPVKSLPIVPVYGLPFYLDNKVQYTGLVHRATDAQRLLNYAASLTAERLALSPKTNFLASTRAVGNHLPLWKDNARSIPGVLLWDEKDEMGNQNAQPIQLNTATDVSDTLAVTTGFTGLVSDVIGMPPEGFGSEGPRQQTAEEALLRAKSGESVLSTLYENLASSIERLGYIVAEMVLATYDTPREITLYDQEAGRGKEMIDLSAMDIDLSSLNVQITSGPLLSTQRKEQVRSYLALAQVLGPAYLPALGPKIAESIDDSDPETVALIRQISQMQVQAPDPAQMQSLQMENDAMRQALQQAQSDLLEMKQRAKDTEIKILADQAMAEQRHQNDLEMEIVRQAGADSQMSKKIYLENKANAADEYRKAQIAVTEKLADVERFNPFE